MALPARVIRGALVDPLEQAHRDFEGLLGRFFGGGEPEAPGRYAPYGVDVREDADHIYVEADLPGFRKEEVNVTLENQVLTITAERKEEKGPPQKKNGGEYLIRERRYNRYMRSFTLPPTVSEQHADAKLADGVLTITLNKLEETKPRRIAVS